MSSNGRYVAFGNYLRDSCLGAPSGCIPTTIQYADPGQGFNANRAAGNLTPDGQHVASSIVIHGQVPTYTGDLEFSTTCIGISSGYNPSTSILIPTQQNYMTVGAMTREGRYLSYSFLGSSSSSGVNDIYDTCTDAAPGCATNADSLPGSWITSLGQDATTGSLYAAVGGNSVTLENTCLEATSPGCTQSDSIISDTAQWCEYPEISSDAQWVIYDCRITSSTWPFPIYNQIFLQNTCVGQTGCTSTAIPISPDGVSGYPRAVSAGGRFVTYQTQTATISNQEVGAMVWVHDSCNGAPSGCTPQTAMVCINQQGEVSDAGCSGGYMSDDGQSYQCSRWDPQTG